MPEVQVIRVPCSLVVECVGLGMDMGGSVLKIVYRTKEDFEEAKSARQNGGYGKLRLVHFPRGTLDEAIDFIKENVHISRNGDEPPLVNGTGVGVYQNMSHFTTELNIQLTVLMEFDCFKDSFDYLTSTMPRRYVMWEPDMNALDTTLALLKEASESPQSKVDATAGDDLVKSVRNEREWSSERPVLDEEDDLFPCLQTMVGSGTGFTKLQKSAGLEVKGMSNRAGRAVFGMGSLLTGCKNFDELIELASRGDPKNLDTYTSYLAKEAGEKRCEDALHRPVDKSSVDKLVTSFGRCVGKKLDDFHVEDRAAALFHYSTMDLAQNAALVARKENINRIFFCGGFFNSPYVRSLMTKQMALHYVNTCILQQGDAAVPLRFDFMKAGAHLGALGCLLKQTPKPTDDTQ